MTERLAILPAGLPLWIGTVPSLPGAANLVIADRSAATCEEHCLWPSHRTKPGTGAADMAPHAPLLNPEDLADLPIGLSGCHPFEALALPPRERSSAHSLDEILIAGQPAGSLESIDRDQPCQDQAILVEPATGCGSERAGGLDFARHVCRDCEACSKSMPLRQFHVPLIVRAQIDVMAGVRPKERLVCSPNRPVDGIVVAKAVFVVELHPAWWVIAQSQRKFALASVDVVAERIVVAAYRPRDLSEHEVELLKIFRAFYALPETPVCFHEAHTSPRFAAASQAATLRRTGLFTLGRIRVRPSFRKRSAIANGAYPISPAFDGKIRFVTIVS